MHYMWGIVNIYSMGVNPNNFFKNTYYNFYNNLNNCNCYLWGIYNGKN